MNKDKFMTEEAQRSILEKFYDDCLNFWKREGKDEIVAMEYALNDIRRVRRNPYAPRGEALDYKVRCEVTEKYRRQLDEVMRRTYYDKYGENRRTE